MPWKQGDPEWVPEAYPKMLTINDYPDRQLPEDGLRH